jgi:hypothetical protein
MYVFKCTLYNIHKFAEDNKAYTNNISSNDTTRIWYTHPEQYVRVHITQLFIFFCVGHPNNSMVIIMYKLMDNIMVHMLLRYVFKLKSECWEILFKN